MMIIEINKVKHRPSNYPIYYVADSTTNNKNKRKARWRRKADSDRACGQGRETMELIVEAGTTGADDPRAQ